MNGKQIGVIVAVVAVGAYLYIQPLKPLPLEDAKATKRGTGTVATAKPAASQNTVTIVMVSATAKTVVGAAEAAKITDLEGQLQSAPDAAKPGLQLKLAKEWDADNQAAPAAFYYQAVARNENTAKNWILAGTRFNDAYRLTQDTTAQPFFDANAVEAFQNATKLAPANLDAKTGLGIAYVNGGGPPMQGISLLLDVVRQDPKNTNALLALGAFAMTSRQYDKAVDRFKTLIAIKPDDVEAYFDIAESYKQLGMRKEAIGAYQKCLVLVNDPAFDQKIEQYIKELKN